jgi:hypothetical protein
MSPGHTKVLLATPKQQYCEKKLDFEEMMMSAL